MTRTALMDKTVVRRQNASKVAEGRLRVAADFMNKGNTRLFLRRNIEKPHPLHERQIGLAYVRFLKI
ncbi:MAG: hypothetical protein HC817_10400 [Saprospiraceae bacterium]|nr:hypothetical protein [Saprospiraceae bacterium]